MIILARVSSLIIFIASLSVIYEEIFIDKIDFTSSCISVGYIILFYIPYLYLSWSNKLVKKLKKQINNI